MRTLGLKGISSPATATSGIAQLVAMFDAGPTLGLVESVQESARSAATSATDADCFMDVRRALRATGKYLPEHCHNAHQRARRRSAIGSGAPPRRSAQQTGRSCPPPLPSRSPELRHAVLPMPRGHLFAPSIQPAAS